MSEALLPALAAAARTAWYAAGLGAAGLALLGLAARRLGAADAAACRRWARRAALAGLLAAGAGFVAQVAWLADGAGLLDPDLWRMAAAAPGGIALGLGGLGCLLILAPGTVLPALGALGVAASHALAGHAAMQGAWGQGLVALHALAVAAWIGSLPALARLARRGRQEDARLMRAWGRLALPGLALLLGSGAGLAVLLTGGAAGLFGSGYGRALLAKLGLVALMLALAARHRFALVPALIAGRAGAGATLARSIGLQAALALGVLGIVALLTGGAFGLPPR